jgi:hypothetical protein
MNARLTSAMLVSAMMRRVNSAGGMATVLHKGEPDVGSILLICMEKGVVQTVRERVLAMDGRYAWMPVGPTASADVDDYLARRRTRDPDLWLIELDIADAERFAAETTGEG